MLAVARAVIIGKENFPALFEAVFCYTIAFCFFHVILIDTLVIFNDIDFNRFQAKYRNFLRITIFITILLIMFTSVRLCTNGHLYNIL